MISRSLFKKPNVPLELEDGQNAPAPPLNCSFCSRTIERAQLESRHFICPRCGNYHKMPPRTRLKALCDANSFVEMDANLTPRDPLGFPGYAQKLEQARQASNETEAVICGCGTIGGFRCGLFLMDAAFMMGSMGCVVGEKITRLFEFACQQGLPVIGFTVSGGARMQEGILSLMQMAKVSGAVRRHADAGLLYIAVLTNPTTGGVAASFAMQADIILAEPGALIGFAGPRVIEQTTHQALPPGFQRAEFQLQKGFVSALAPREGQKQLLTQLLGLHQKGEAHASL